VIGYSWIKEEFRFLNGDVINENKILVILHCNLILDATGGNPRFEPRLMYCAFCIAA
jgi:hypothetical protein